MKTNALLSLTLTSLLAGCGGGGGHQHGHGHHGHGHGHGVDGPPPEEVQISAKAMQQFGIRVEAVGRRTLQPTFTVPARVAVNEEATAHVGTLVNGRVAEMRVHLGDRVKAGEVLFVIESQELGAAQNALLKALAAVVSAQEAVKLAQINPLTAQAQAKLKSTEAMIALAQNPATINAAKADLAAAKAAAVLAKNTAAIAQAGGELAAAKPPVATALQLVESGRKLAADGALAQSELQRRETVLKTAQAKVQAAEAALDQVKAKQDRDLKAADAAIAAAHASLAQAEAQQARDLAAARAKQAAASVELQAAAAKESKETAEARNGLATAEAGVKQCRNQLQLLGMTAEEIDAFAAKPELSPRYTVRAPRDGTVMEREVTQGESVTVDQPHLLMLADLTKVWVVMDTPPARAGALRTGLALTLRNAANGAETAAKLNYISPTVDPETRTVRARVELDNADGRWLPGQFLTALVSTGKPAQDSLAVPSSAVQYVDGKAVVYELLPKENTFRQVPVTIGAFVDGWAPVTSGLKENMKIVTHSSFVLKAEFGKAGAGHDHSH